MLKDKNIVLGMTGGIAAYKVPHLVRELRKACANVRAVMTDAAKEFVSPMALSTVSGAEVVVGMFPSASSSSINVSTWHIELAKWADVMLIAPATANTIAKLAHGYADNAVTTLALALRCPLVVSPAMDTDMWQHPLTQENILKLRELGCVVLPPEEGELASGLTGTGRLPELTAIINAVDDVLKNAHRDLQRKKILVTAGPTHEAIDPVRYIGNRSSGKMGFAIANAAAQRGADVTLITGKVALQTPRHVRRIDVESAQQMYNAVMKQYRSHDVVIMAAAVADFTPKSVSSRKIKKEEADDQTVTIELKRTKNILQCIGENKDGILLVGFALETHDDIANAKRKLKEKHLDLVVVNNPTQEGAGFGEDTNVVTIISKTGKIERLKKMSKFDVAHEILNRVVTLL